ncbi:MAG: hypothetical protein F4X83_04735 [Chloroflexi bacterium]|nr:hypothetical protein [Chloroflexota bacterium]
MSNPCFTCAVHKEAQDPGVPDRRQVTPAARQRVVVGHVPAGLQREHVDWFPQQVGCALGGEWRAAYLVIREVADRSATQMPRPILWGGWVLRVDL